MNIAATRKIQSALKIAAATHGYTILDADFLTIEYIDNTDVRNILQTNNCCFIFTSKHAVLGIKKIIESGFEFKKMPCFCIAGSTAEAARSAGLPHDREP